MGKFVGIVKRSFWLHKLKKAVKGINMKFIIFLLSLIFLVKSVSAGDGDFFEVEGEQLVYKVSSQWKPSWMGGDSKGGFFIEYIPEYEQINTWKFGYLKIQRYPYPSTEILEKIKVSGTRISELAVLQLQDEAAKGCGGKHEKMTQKTSTFNGMIFSVSGGFCDKYGKAAPYGEGSVFAFIEGVDFLHSVQYSWRPVDKEMAKENAPWGIFSPLLAQYLNDIKLITSCGSSSGDAKACAGKYPIRVTSETIRNPVKK